MQRLERQLMDEAHERGSFHHLDLFAQYRRDLIALTSHQKYQLIVDLLGKSNMNEVRYLLQNQRC